MNFQELKDRVLADAFPDGTPENLVSWLERAVLNGAIEAQRHIPCLRAQHDDVYDACNTFWRCGTSVITKPDGEITRVYTVDASSGEDWCNPVVYRPVQLQALRRWTAWWKLVWRTELYAAPASGAGLPRGFDVPNTTSDALSGRAITGMYAVDKTSGRLIISPWLQSTEKLVVEWTGIKKSFSAGDLVPSDEDYIRLLRLFVELEYSSKYVGSNFQLARAAYDEALRDLIITCRRSTHLSDQMPSQEEGDVAYERQLFIPNAPEVEDPVDDTVIAFVGDSGTADANAQAVADAITEQNPSMVVIAGDVKYAPNDAISALAPYVDFIAQNKLRAALGNHDLDDGHLGSDVTTYAKNPGNGRYFSFTSGPVGVHVINSGINTAGQFVEPDGNFDGSPQYNAIAAAISRDTSRWKIVVLHHPPYTSDVSYYPGRSVVRWAADLPVHAVICGHAHSYERLVVRGRIILVAGTGGSALRGFASTPYAGSVVRIQEFGFLKLTADCKSARFEFLDVDGNVDDSVDLPDTIPSAPIEANFDPVITLHPESVTVGFGGDALLEVTAIGTAPLTYQWQREGVDVSGATSPTLELTNVMETTTYRVLVKSALGAVISSECTVGSCNALLTTFIYWGTGGNPTSESDITGLNSEYAESAETIKNFPAGGYRIIAWPDSFGSPRALDGIIDPVTGFAFGMAGTADGYTLSENNWSYKLMTVGGRLYRIYRSYNPIGAAHSLQVQQ